jgi:hypothetical protein
VRKTHTHTHLNLCLRHTRYEINPREKIRRRKRKRDITFWSSKCRIIRFVIYDMSLIILLLLFKWEEDKQKKFICFVFHTHITRLLCKTSVFFCLTVLLARLNIRSTKWLKLCIYIYSSIRVIQKKRKKGSIAQQDEKKRSTLEHTHTKEKKMIYLFYLFLFSFRKFTDDTNQCSIFFF